MNLLMFLGHLALGFAAKRSAPRAPLAWLLAAPLAVDLVWPFFLLTGLEQVRVDPAATAFTPLDFVSYPYTHSLLAVAVWSVLMAIAYWAFRGDAKGARIVALLVLSHWFLDALTHRPDLPLYPGGTERFGLGLWQHPPLTVAVELAMFLTGVLVYNGVTRPDRPSESNWMRGYLFLLLALYIAAFAGPAPPDELTVALSALALWLIPVLAIRVEKNRLVIR